MSNHIKISKQQGAVLSISLVLLFLLSILGLAVMRTSTLEEKMAINALHDDMAFQITETVTEEVINNTSNMTNAFDSSTNSVSINYENPKMSNIEAESTMTYVGKGAVEGYSLGEFVAYRFVVDSTGKIDEANTSTRIVQGVYRIAPASLGN